MDALLLLKVVDVPLLLQIAVVLLSQLVAILVPRLHVKALWPSVVLKSRVVALAATLVATS